MWICVISSVNLLLICDTFYNLILSLMVWILTPCTMVVKAVNLTYWRALMTIFATLYVIKPLPQLVQKVIVLALWSSNEVYDFHQINYIVWCFDFILQFGILESKFVWWKSNKPQLLHRNTIRNSYIPPWGVVVLHIGVRCNVSNITVQGRYGQHS